MSRPRKRVLIFSALELGSTPVVFVLDTRGMHARAVRTAEDFAEQLGSFAPEAALIFYDGSASSAAARACEDSTYERGIPSLVAARVREKVQAQYATMILQRDLASMAEIVHWLKVLCARKRGPKKTDGMNVYRGLVAGRSAAAASARLA